MAHGGKDCVKYAKKSFEILTFLFERTALKCKSDIKRET